jgi:N-methylhydantoinase A
MSVRRSADMRYGEQVFEIAVDLEGLDWEAPDLVGRIEAAFHRAHEALYTYSSPDQDVVLVNARTSVIGRLPAAGGGVADRASECASPKGVRCVWLGGWADVPVFDFAALGSDQSLAGPAIVESDTTTVLLRRGDAARFDARGWLEIMSG